MNIEKYCKEIIEELNPVYDIDESLEQSFITIIKYLNEFPKNLSMRSKKIECDVSSKSGIEYLAVKYFQSYYLPTIPTLPKTVPDEAVSLIMKKVFNYSEQQANEIKKTHQESMACENAVGTLLERYLDSELRKSGWAWCCGNFVKAIDFIKFDKGKWFELQIKNRSNSENSSSSAIRTGTEIHKWYRIDANSGSTKWDVVPELMKKHNLSENGFKAFIEKYIQNNKHLIYNNCCIRLK